MNTPVRTRVRNEVDALQRISLRQRAARHQRELRTAGPRTLRFPSGVCAVASHAWDADERRREVKL